MFVGSGAYTCIEEGREREKISAGFHMAHLLTLTSYRIFPRQLSVMTFNIDSTCLFAYKFPNYDAHTYKRLGKQHILFKQCLKAIWMY